MRMKSSFVLLVGICVLLASVAVFAHDGETHLPEGYIYEWSTNIEEAVEEAQGNADDAEEDEDADDAEEVVEKHVFVYFAGSDWCPHCMRFEKEVVNSPTFRRYLEKNFVPVLIDSPRYYHLSEEQQTYNNARSAEYEIRGFPTVVILRPSGETLGALGYNREGANGFIRVLKRAIN